MDGLASSRNSLRGKSTEQHVLSFLATRGKPSKRFGISTNRLLSSSTFVKQHAIVGPPYRDDVEILIVINIREDRTVMVFVSLVDDMTTSFPTLAICVVKYI